MVTTASMSSVWNATQQSHVTSQLTREAMTNFTVEESLFGQDSVTIAAISITLGILTLTTVIGNLFVMIAILMDKNLNNLGNYLVLSLAVADLMVACLVMPLGAVYEVKQQWVLGPELCDVWTSCDVLCCTASILHLLAIAVDRYWAVTNVDYARNRKARSIYLMIVFVWGVALVVSVAPIFGWKDANFRHRIEEEKRCLVSQDVAYQVFATCFSFYFPLILILILYYRIFQEARKRIRHRPGAKAVLLVQRPPPALVPRYETSSSSTDISLSQNFNLLPDANGVGKPQQGGVGRILHLAKREKREKKQESVELKRERKAAKTLAIITGVFVICWLPFFVTALVMPLCSSCEPSPYVFSFFLWLGYVNSMLNPIIYTIFSPDFRSAFRKLLCGPPSTPRPNV